MRSQGHYSDPDNIKFLVLMAALDQSNASPNLDTFGGANGELEDRNDEEKRQIQKMLSRHDPNGGIAARIHKCLLEDDLTLEDLNEFDDTSLQQTIDAWNIKSFHKKPHIIRGLLIKGIKKFNKSDYNKDSSIDTFGGLINYNGNSNLSNKANNNYFGMMLEDSRTKLTPNINNNTTNDTEDDTKLNDREMSQVNTQTKKQRTIYTKNGSIHTRYTAHWAFINEDNVLIKLDSKYEQFLNSLNHAKLYQSEKYNNVYTIEKISESQAIQTNIQSQTVRDLYRVLYITPNKITIEKKVGKKMIGKLFFHTVDSNTYKIQNIETVVYHDKELYYKQYEKYEKKYKQGSSLERWLFHGTDSKILKQIETNGFDRNFNKTSLYGKVE